MIERIIPLDKNQIALVENNISVINTVIFSRIIIDKNTYGLEYDDLFQEGALLLCKAALCYDVNKNSSFKTFAYVVVRNGLFSYCKKMCKKKKNKLSYIQKAEDFSDFKVPDDVLLQEKIIEFDIVFFLENLKKQYSGTAALGIEALILKVKGLSSVEIANMYNVKPNHIGAWISRAMKKLRENSVFNLYMKDLFNT